MLTNWIEYEFKYDYEKPKQKSEKYEQFFQKNRI